MTDKPNQDELTKAVLSLNKEESLQEAMRAVHDFYVLCPSFCDTPENWATLCSYLPKEFDEFLHWPTTLQMVEAYVDAVADGKFRLH